LLIFVDESGQPHQIDEGPYVLSSIAVDEENLGEVNDSITSFIDNVRNRFNIDVSEIHAKYLVKGNYAWRSIRMEERARLFQRIANIISNLNITLNIVSAVKKRPGVKITSPYGIRKHVIKMLLERLYLTPSKYSIAVMIFDSSSIKIDINIRKEVEEAVEEALSPQTYRLYVSFSNSKKEPALQIADYIAYLMKHILMKQYKWGKFDFEKAFLTIESKIRRCPHKDVYEGCGLKVWEIE